MLSNCPIIGCLDLYGVKQIGGCTDIWGQSGELNSELHIQDVIDRHKDEKKFGY